MEDLVLWLCVFVMIGFALVISVISDSSRQLFHINETLTELEAELLRKEAEGGSK